MTYVSTAEISPEMFVTVLLFLLVIAPLFSLAIMRFSRQEKAGFILIGSGVATYVVFQIIMSLFLASEHDLSVRLATYLGKQKLLPEKSVKELLS